MKRCVICNPDGEGNSQLCPFCEREIENIVRKKSREIKTCIVCNENSVDYPWVCSNCIEKQRKTEKRWKIIFWTVYIVIMLGVVILRELYHFHFFIGLSAVVILGFLIILLYGKMSVEERKDTRELTNDYKFYLWKKAVRDKAQEPKRRI